MKTYVALLRAINVGGTGKLPMAQLRELCEKTGFTEVRTYIQSGNVLLKSPLAEAKVQAKLEEALRSKMGKGVGVLVRSGAELADILARNPFGKAPPNRVIVFLLDEKPPKDALASLVIPGKEVVKVSGREVFVHYPDGQGVSKLKLPFLKAATGRNLNTLAKLAALAKD